MHAAGGLESIRFQRDAAQHTQGARVLRACRQHLLQQLLGAIEIAIELRGLGLTDGFAGRIELKALRHRSLRLHPVARLSQRPPQCETRLGAPGGGLDCLLQKIHRILGPSVG